MCNYNTEEDLYDLEFGPRLNGLTTAEFDSAFKNRDPLEVLSDQDFLDWVEGKDLQP